MKKIAFLLGGFQGNGGIGRVTSILINNMQPSKTYEIHAISYVKDERELLYDIDSSIKQYALFPSARSMTKAMLFNNAVGKLRKYIKKNKIEVIIACGALFYPAAILACSRTGCECYCWEHINPSTTTDYKFQGLCRKFALKYAKKIIVLTKSAQKYYLETLKCKAEKLVQIYNPTVDGIRNSEYDVSSKKIVVAGRLCEQKNYAAVLQLAKKLKSQYPDWKWELYGEGELRNKIEKGISDMKLADNVTLMGQVNDMYERYPRFSFMVMTSLYEGFPMVLLEGMSAGLPLVSFDIETGPNEIIENGKNGYLIEPFDIEEMYKKIVYLIEHEEIRVRFSQNSKLLCQRFKLENILKKWDEIL